MANSEKVSPPPAQPKAKADKIIYTGPTDRARGLFWHALYREIPEHLVSVVAEIPAIAARFVKFESSFAKRRPPGARIRRPLPASPAVSPAHVESVPGPVPVPIRSAHKAKHHSKKR